MLVSALAHQGRQREALDAVARARRALAIELGLEPSSNLKELERAILEQRETTLIEWPSPALGPRPAEPTTAAPSTQDDEPVHHADSPQHRTIAGGNLADYRLLLLLVVVVGAVLAVLFVVGGNSDSLDGQATTGSQAAGQRATPAPPTTAAGSTTTAPASTAGAASVTVAPTTLPSTVTTSVRRGDESSTGQSEPVPVTTTSTTATTPTAALPSTLSTGETLPPGAERFDRSAELSGIGACIWRAAAQPGQLDIDRASYEVPCDQPHHAEFLAFEDLDARPGAPYPAETELIAHGEQMCERAFADYVGTTWQQSRLNYAYFYPTLDGWEQGDRRTSCFLAGSYLDELFTHSMRDSGE